MNVIQQYLKNTYKLNGYGYSHVEVRPRIECEDGFTISVQASQNMYCEPRVDLDTGMYTRVELGYPSEEDELILPYAEDPETPVETVYGYVPIGLVEQLINKHGGIKK